jgi:ParB/RepB/Spo0J family partition protein
MIQFRNETIPLDAVDAPATPLRESIDPQYLNELADSIASLGLLQLIGLRGPSDSGRYEVVWGDCRTRALRILGETTTTARVCPWETDPGEARAAENLHRQELNPREEAREVKRLADEGKSAAHIGRIMRRSPTWVDSRLELLTWPTDLQDQVAAGELPLSSARLLAAIDHAPYRQNLLNEVTRTGANASTIRVWVAHYENDRDRIIRNDETVQQIIASRQSFIVLCECAGCGDEVDTRATALIRLCGSCNEAIANAKEQAMREHSQTPNPR